MQPCIRSLNPAVSHRFEFQPCGLGRNLSDFQRKQVHLTKISRNVLFFCLNCVSWAPCTEVTPGPGDYDAHQARLALEAKNGIALPKSERFQEAQCIEEAVVPVVEGNSDRSCSLSGIVGCCLELFRIVKATLSLTCYRYAPLIVLNSHTIGVFYLQSQ